MIAERESLIIEALDTESVTSRVIIGTPESQIVAAVPVFRENENASWELLGVVVAANNINDAYVANIGEILNVEAAIINPERQVVATTLGNSSQIQDDIMYYENQIGIFHETDPIYFDYDNVLTDEPLRAINTPLIVQGEERGYLLVARSFEAVINLERQLTQLFFTFSGAILGASIALLIFLVGIPAWRNRQAQKL